jgi:hypothetical protein
MGRSLEGLCYGEVWTDLFVEILRAEQDRRSGWQVFWLGACGGIWVGEKIGKRKKRLITEDAEGEHGGHREKKEKTPPSKGEGWTRDDG